MEKLNLLTENQLIVSIVSLIIGAVLYHVISKITNKTKTLRYLSIFNRVGLSTDDSIFGSVRAMWQGQQVRNLHFFTIEVENSTSTDFENIEFKVYSGNDTIILNERTEVVDTPYIVPLSDEYQARMIVPEGESATQQQVNEYNHNRQYMLEVFNRGQKIRFSYLCTKPNDDLEPGVFISTPAKGVKLKRQLHPSVIINPIFGVPVPVATVRAFFISVLVVILCVLFINKVWIAASLSMFVGLTGQIFGAIAYKIENVFRKSISG